MLRPEGRLGLVWNMRDESVPWVERLSETIGAERVDAVDIAATVAASGLYDPVEGRHFAFAQELDREGLRALVLSRSYCASRPPDEREAILEQVGDLFDEEAVVGALVLPYTTFCARAIRR